MVITYGLTGNTTAGSYRSDDYQWRPNMIGKSFSLVKLWCSSWYGDSVSPELSAAFTTVTVTRQPWPIESPIVDKAKIAVALGADVGELMFNSHCGFNGNMPLAANDILHFSVFVYPYVPLAGVAVLANVEFNIGWQIKYYGV